MDVGKIRQLLKSDSRNKIMHKQRQSSLEMLDARGLHQLFNAPIQQSEHVITAANDRLKNCILQLVLEIFCFFSPRDVWISHIQHKPIVWLNLQKCIPTLFTSNRLTRSGAKILRKSDQAFRNSNKILLYIQICFRRAKIQDFFPLSCLLAQSWIEPKESP